MRTNFTITKEKLASLIDHSILGPTVSHSDVDQWCDEAIRYGFACVYVNPCDATYAKKRLEGRIPLGVPIGFPTGIFTTKNKISEGLEAIDNGADELDTVMNLSRLLDGEDDYVLDELIRWNQAMKEYKPDVLTKVIVECHYLNREQIVRSARIVEKSGADYVKTSTGYSPHPTFLLSDVHIVRQAVSSNYKVKVSGHIPRVEDAIACVQYGVDRIGNDQGAKWMEQFNGNMWSESL